MKSDPFKKVCRLCLTTGSKLMSIYNKKKKCTQPPWSQTIILLLPMIEVKFSSTLFVTKVKDLYNFCYF